MARVDSLTTEGLDLLVQQSLSAATQTVTDEVAALLDSQTAANVALLGSKAPTDPTFKINTVYKAGQLVVYAGRMFAAKADFTSGATWNAGNWSYVGLPIVVNDQAARDAISPFDGLQVYRLDTHMLELYANTSWVCTNGPIVCTSATRPPGYAGMMIYETDTKLVYIFGTTWVMIKPGGPRGYVGGMIFATTTIDYLAGTTSIMNLSVQVVAGRKYKITGYVFGQQVSNVSTGTRVQMHTSQGGDTIHIVYATGAQPQEYISGTANIFLTALTTGTLSIDMSALVTASAFRLTQGNASINVEDIGI